MPGYGSLTKKRRKTSPPPAPPVTTLIVTEDPDAHGAMGIMGGEYKYLSILSFNIIGTKELKFGKQ